MEMDYSSFIEKNDDGTIKTFDESKLTSFIDSAISKGVNSGVEKYKAQAQKEAELAKMNDQEKLNQQLQDFEKAKADWETLMKSQKRDIVVEKAKAKLGSNFSEAEVALFVKNVTDDEKESLKYIDSLVEERNKFIEKTKKEIIESVQSKNPVGSSTANSDNANNQAAPQKRTAEDIKKHYLN